ncbi:MAG: hypothetical protein U0529_04235 [Thermoanaerobaculia bacterium]
MKKSLGQLARTTLMGAVLVLLPIVLVSMLLEQALPMADAALRPFTTRMAQGSGLGPGASTLLAILLLIVFCFLGGVFAQTSVARKSIAWLETSVLSQLPGFEYVKAQIESGFRVEERHVYPVVLARMDDAWQLAFLVESLADGRSAVFVPDVPSPDTGAVYFLTADRVRPIDVPPAAALKCLKRFGLGAGAILGGQLPSGSTDART